MKKLAISFILLITLFSAQSQTKNFLDLPYMEVAGNADTLLTPNEIYIKIFISEKDTKDRVSLEELEKKMYNALKALVFELDKNLTTSDMASNYKTYLLKGKDVMKSKEYMLKVGDAVTASKVLIELERLGISNTSIDRVDHSELESYQNLMRTKAVENARTRALALTKPLNQSVGPAIHIADNEMYAMAGRYDKNLQEVVVVAYAAAPPPGADLPKIEFEKIRVAANINVKFLLK